MFFRNRNNHVRRDSNPYLRPYCIFILPPEGFDFQVLFDPFKRYFHVPSAFIKFCYGLTTNFIVVCQENKSPVKFAVIIFYPPEIFRIIFAAIESLEFYFLITQDILLFVYRLGFDPFKLRESLKTRFKIFHF